MLYFFINIPIFSQNYPLSKYSQYIIKEYQEQIRTISKLIDNPLFYLDPLWLKLIHYKKTIWNNYESDIDSPDFFLSRIESNGEFPIGKWDPRKELLATFESFFVESNIFSNIEHHPMCAFPARLKYIKNILKRINQNIVFPDVGCRNFDLFLKEFDTKSLSYIFASYFLGAPASIFGHTFIKINSKQKKDELLDYSINYAANPGDIDIFRYIIYGLFGGYKGYYSVLPYHLKIHEYNDIEERDLWEYELDLNEEQIDWILKHLWEVANFSYMDYYFATENCSYQILTLLQIGLDENIDFVNQLYGFVIPTETVKILKQYNLIKKRNYRPSIKSQILQRYELMNKKEKNYYNIIFKNRLVPFFNYSGMNSNQENVNYLFVYDTLLLHYKYLKIKKELKEEDIPYYQALLINRTKYPIDAHSYTFRPMSTPIDNAHKQKFVSLEYGNLYINKKYYSIMDIELRYLYHDFLNDPEGFPDFTELENFYLHIQYNSYLNLTYIKRFKLLNIYSLSSYHPLFFTPSYHVEVGYKNVQKETFQFDLNRYFIVSPKFPMEINSTLLITKNPIYYNKEYKELQPLAYGTFTGGISFSNKLQNFSILGGLEVDSYKFSYKGELIYILRLLPLQILLKSSYLWFGKNKYGIYNINLSFNILKNFEIRVINEWENKFYCFKIGFVNLF